MLFYFFLFTVIFCEGGFAQNFSNNSQRGLYFPLALGNKWQYFVTSYSSNPDTYRYSIYELSVTDTQTINNLLYFKYDNKWMRYDEPQQKIFTLNNAGNEQLYCNFNIPANSSYNCYFGEVIALSEVITTCGLSDTAKGVKFHNWDVSTPTWYYHYFSKNFGYSRFKESGHAPGGRDWVIIKKLINFFSADTSLALSNFDVASPSISDDILKIDSLSKLNITVKVAHAYSRLTEPVYPGYTFYNTGVSFIDTVYFEYFYTNGIDTLWNNSSIMSAINEMNFKTDMELDFNLLNQGYNLYYRIIAVDKSLNKHTKYYPGNGYKKAVFYTGYNALFNYYPIKTNNIFVYKYEEIVNGGNSINLGYKYINFYGETTLANNLTYNEVNKNNTIVLERFDNEKSIIVTPVLLPNNEIKEEPVQFLWAKSNNTYPLFVNGNMKTFTCTGIANTNVLNSGYFPSKTYTSQDNTSVWFRLAYKYGIFENQYFEDNHLYKQTLVAAKVNDVIYGNSELIVGVEEQNIEVIPAEYSLKQNYPNPFNPSTTISFSIPKAEFLTLKIFDILGNEVANLVNEELQAGSYNKEWNPAGLSSGIYFYRLQAGQFSQTHKMNYHRFSL
ncbi:MAG: T9SS type A sorting domain-containing protein [bacterium]